MAEITLTYEHESIEMGKLTEKGMSADGWTLAADARIKTEANTLGVGPLVYKGRPKTADGKVSSKEGIPRDAVFLFYLDSECRRAELSMEDPDDINDTIAAFLASHGGDLTDMAAKAPTVS